MKGLVVGKLLFIHDFLLLNLALKVTGYNDLTNTYNLALRMLLIQMTKLQELGTVSKSRSVNIPQGLIPVSNSTKKPEYYVQGVLIVIGWRIAS